MSGHIVSHPAFSRKASNRAVQVGAARAVTGMWLAALARMTRSIEERRLLATLDDRMLADIGVSRSEADREANRSPWDVHTRD